MNTNNQPNMVLLAVISGISSFSLAIVLPALPSLAEQYDTDAAGIQFLVSAYLVGLALSQPVWGHVTDRIGRRPVVLYGFALFVVASLCCAATDSLATLTILRAVQAFGASTGTVVARAVIRDTHAAEHGARAMSWITIGLGAAPIIAPVIGGGVLLYGNSDWLFFAMAIVGSLLWLLLYWQLRETLPASAKRPAWGSLFSSYRQLLGSRGFVGYTAVYGMVQGAFFAFLAVGAAVFADSFGLGPAAFGVIWGFMGAAYVLGAIVGGRLSSGARRPLLLPVSMTSTLVLGLLIALFDQLLGARLLTVLLPLFLMMALSGATTPLVMAGAVYQLPHLAGTAAGLSSAIGMTLGGTFTVAAGVLYGGDFTPIALLIGTAGTLTFLSWLIVRRM